MRKKLIIIALVCSVMLNGYMGFRLLDKASYKSEFYHSATAAWSYFFTYSDYLKSGHSVEEPRIRAISALSSMLQMLSLVDKSSNHDSTLRFFIDMLIINPKDFEPHITEIMDILTLLEKDCLSDDAYFRMDKLLEPFKG